MAAEQPETRPQQSAETANTITNELLRRLLRQQKLQTEKRKRRKTIDWIALGTALGALGAAAVAIWSVHVASQANLASEQQQLLTLTTNIVEQAANHTMTGDSSGPAQPKAIANNGAAYTAQMSAEGESGQELIKALHGSGVTSIEYIEVGQALNIGGDSASALADYETAASAPPDNPLSIAQALRFAGSLEYELGHTLTGHSDMMLALKAFSGPQPYITDFTINRNGAQTLYDDAGHQILDANNCEVARVEMAYGYHFVTRLGGINNAPPPIPLEFQNVQSLYKQHCSGSKS